MSSKRKQVSRRAFNQGLGALGVGLASGLAAPAVLARAKARVVVVGGGFGGASAAPGHVTK